MICPSFQGKSLGRTWAEEAVHPPSLCRFGFAAETVMVTELLLIVGRILLRRSPIDACLVFFLTLRGFLGSHEEKTFIYS